MWHLTASVGDSWLIFSIMFKWMLTYVYDLGRQLLGAVHDNLGQPTPGDCRWWPRSPTPGGCTWPRSQTPGGWTWTMSLTSGGFTWPRSPTPGVDITAEVLLGDVHIWPRTPSSISPRRWRRANTEVLLGVVQCIWPRSPSTWSRWCRRLCWSSPGGCTMYMT